MRVLITGADGFVGKNLVAELRKDPRLTLIAPDLSQLDLLKQSQVLEATKGVECIIHLAAVLQTGHTPGSRVLRDNIRMAEHLIEAARLNGVKRIVTLGTALLYNRGPQPYREDQIAINPSSEKQEYVMAKAALLTALTALHREEGTSVIYLVPPNLYGPEDHYDVEGAHFVARAISLITRAADAKEPSVRFSGPGDGSREWMYVEDLAHAIRSVLTLDGLHILNVSSDARCSPRELARQVAEHVGYKGDLLFAEGTTSSIALDTSRIELILPQRKTPLSAGLKMTIAWYRNASPRRATAPSIARWPEQIGVGAVRISDQAKRNVLETLEANRLSYGPFHRRFEQEFARAHGCKHGIFTNSGTSSLQIAVAVLKERYGWKDGDEVLCPATTFIATSNVILQNNLTPVFVDVDRETYNIDPARIEDRITPRTRGIMVVHLYGHPTEMDPILRLCERHGLRMIEDSAETMYATYKGRPVGSFGDIACFSTYACHLLVTGVGGMTTTNDDTLAIMLRSSMNHGRDSIYLSIDDDKGKTGDDLRMVMEGRFRFVRMGYSYRATEMEAALGHAQLEEMPQNITVRQENARLLTAGLRKWRKYLQLPTIRPDCTHAFMMYTILIQEDAPFTREELTLFLEELNIETRTMVSLLDQPYYQRLFGDLEPQYPVARWIDRRGFYIGCHQEMGEKEIRHIHDAFDAFFAKMGLEPEMVQVAR